MGKLTLTALLRAMVDQDASDLHITCNTPPQFRIHGKLMKAKTDPLTPDSIKELVYEILTEQQKKTFETSNELDFSFGVKLKFERIAVLALSLLRNVPCSVVRSPAT